MIYVQNSLFMNYKIKKLTQISAVFMALTRIHTKKLR
jgi:hypothetical protein